MLYAVKVRQILSETVLVEAESFDDAVQRTAQYNSEVGIDPDEVEDMVYEMSEFSNDGGSATAEQADEPYMLRI